MSTFHQCPICGYTKKTQELADVKNALPFFCDSCANEEFDHFPLPFRTTHCPRCGSTDIVGVGGIWD